MNYLLYPFHYLTYLVRLLFWRFRTHMSNRSHTSHSQKKKPRFLLLFLSTFLVALIPIIVYTTKHARPTAAANWNFDEGYGTSVTDTSSSNYVATITGPTWQSEEFCIQGKCLYFDGSDDYIASTATDIFDAGAAYTIMAWIRPTFGGEAATETFLAKDGVVEFSISDTNDNIILDYSGNSASSNTNSIIANRWQHVAITHNGSGTFKFYIDGIDQTSDGSATDTNSTGAVIFGSETSGTTSESYQGFLDGVKIFTSELTAAQIKTHIPTGTSDDGSSATIGDPTDYLSQGLVGYWKMDDNVSGDSQTITDSSGNDNDGTTSDGGGTTLDCTSGGQFGYGCDFDGTNDEIQVTQSSEINLSGTGMTASFWIQDDNWTATQQRIIYKNNNYECYNTTSQLICRVYLSGDEWADGATYSLSNLPTNEWVHVTFTYEAPQTGKLFINGIHADTNTYYSGRGETQKSSTNDIYIGSGNTFHFADADLDEIRLYNRTLSPQEISALYHWAPGPIGHWKLDENYAETDSNPSGYSIFAYADGSSTTDLMKYRLMDSDGDWVAAAANTADVDSGSTNKEPTLLKVFANPTKNEFMLLSGHWDGSSYYVYGQALDVDTTSWSTPERLDNGGISSSVYKQYFDGAYLSDGRFLAVTADDSNYPYYSFWDDDSESWTTTASSLADIGGNPLYVVTKARPGTTEAMVAFMDDQRDTNTCYYDGAGETNSDFSCSEQSTTNGYHLDDTVDFTWSTNTTTRGALVYSNNYNDHTPNINIFTANGSGGGSWGTEDESVTTSTTDISRLYTIDRPDADEFIVCARDDSADINCIEEADGDTTPTLTSTTNQEIEDNTYSSITTYSVGIGYEQESGNTAIAVFSDNTSTPKLKKYDPSTNTWDSSDTSLDDTSTSNQIRTITVHEDPNSDDMAIIVRGDDKDAWLAFWDGTNDQIYDSGDRDMAEYSTDCGWGSTAHAAGFAYPEYSPSATGNTVYDTSTNQNNGTLNGSMLTQDWVPGKYGTGLDLDGSDDYISVSDTAEHDFAASQSFTTEAWVKHDGAIATNSDYILTKADTTNGGYKLYMDNSGDFCFAIDDDSTWTPDDSACTSGVDYDDSTWHHVVGIKDGTSGIYLYVDGILVASDTSIAATNTLANSNDLLIGVDRDGTSNSWDGVIDDIRIYNYARSAQQTVEDMNAGHPTGGSPVGSQTIYYKFDEGYGTTANDTISNQNGTVDSNLTWKTQANCKINGCLQWDAANEEVSIATADDTLVDFNGSESFSGSAWVYITTMPGNGNQDAIIAKWDDTNNLSAYKLYVENDDADSTGHFEVQIYDESASQAITAYQPNDSVSQNTWYHVAFTFNGGTAGAAGDLKLYVNGTYVAQNSTNGSFAGLEDKASDFTIGEYDSNDTESNNTAFTGYIDEVKIYSSALTADQIKIDYNAGASINLGTGTNEADDLADGAGNPPVGYWPMDENTGTSNTYDKSGNSLGGTLTSITESSWVPGKKGSAIDFDGTADMVSVSDNSVLDIDGDNITFSAWVNFTSSDTDRVIIEKGGWANGNWQLVTDNSDGGYMKVNFYNCSDDNTVSTTQVNDGKWHHVTAVKDSSYKYVYIDGVLKDYSACSANISSNNGDLTFGGRTGGSNYFDGTIDEVKIYDYTLTPAQIAYEYNRGAPIAWYKLDECMGNTAYDSMPASNSGTISIGGSGTNTSYGHCDSGTSSHSWYNGVTGKRNASLDFDGTDDYVYVSDNTANSITGSITVTAWVKGLTSSDVVVAKWDGPNNDRSYHLYAGDSTPAQPTFRISDDGSSGGMETVQATNTIDTNWHHWTGVFDAADQTLDIYVDGKKAATTVSTSATSIEDNGASLTIGAEMSSGSPTGYADGQIDDVRLYNYPLSQTQIRKIINEGGVRFGPLQGSP